VGLTAHHRQQRRRKKRRDDVQRIQPFVGGAVPADDTHAVDRLHQDHVNLEKDCRQQVIDHQRQTLT